MAATIRVSLAKLKMPIAGIGGVDVLVDGETRAELQLGERAAFDVSPGERGNSGCALRAPMFGDPAFDGLELQMVDLRYNPQAESNPSELTGGLYRAVPPRRQVYRPTQWNRYEITREGTHLKVVLNDVLIHDTDLKIYTTSVKRHDGTDARPVADRPRGGHIGFQELSRGGSHVQIRNAKIKVLEAAETET